MGNTRAQNKANAKRYIDTAIEVLEATGWCRGLTGETRITTVGGDGKHCAVGSLAAAHFILDGHLPTSEEKRALPNSDGIKSFLVDEYFEGTPHSAYRRALKALYDALPDPIPGRYGSTYQKRQFRDYVSALVLFNDALDEDGKPVLLDVFRRASESLS